MNERPRLLIVEEDAELAESLADAGYDAVTACDAERAFRLSRREPPPSLILLDLVMPRMNGWHFRERQLRDRRTRDIPVVLMTASRDLRPEPLCTDTFLLKPFSLDELLEQVQSIVDSA